MGKILLYNVNMMMVSGITKVASSLGHQVMVVEPEFYGAPIGQVAMGRANSKYKATSISGEMMVMVGLFGKSLDEFIDSYNAAGIPKIICKAVLTPNNSLMNAKQLFDELEEHSQNMK